MYSTQELLPTQQEGQSKVTEVRVSADKVLPQTAPQGQQQIRREVDALKFDWEKYSSKLSETKTALESSLAAWEQFDGLHDELTKWLKEMEAKIRDQDLKSTLQDKKSQVEQLKVG